jgi:putative hydrolase of the HAD superfamily
VIEMVFFDAGDTILHPHPSFAELFSQVCAESDVGVTPEQVEEVQSRLAPHLIDLAEDTGVKNPSFSLEGSRVFWGFLYRRFLREWGIEDDALAEALRLKFSDRSSYLLFDDVLPVLRRLRSDGYRLGLISNFEGWLEERLVELEAGPLFDTSVISGFVHIEKPDPRIYLLALEEAGVEADRAVHVGDSVTLDVAPAQSVGMHPVLLDRSGRYPQPEVAAIKSLEELPPLLATL